VKDQTWERAKKRGRDRNPASL